MLVVADSSPLIVLVKVGHIDILPKLFGQIVIPPAVAAELRREPREPAIRTYYNPLPPWLDVRTPKRVEAIPALHEGETEAISLAIELGADLLLVDERKAYKEAGRTQGPRDWHRPRAGTCRRSRPSRLGRRLRTG